MTTEKNNLSTIRISGPDTDTFLQGIVTCDITHLKHAPMTGACCNRQGRIIGNFWCYRDGEDVLLYLPTAIIDTTLAHLKKYGAFSKISITVDETSKLITNIPQQIDQNWVWIYPETSEKFTPQMINLEKTGGVDFKKGCYLGQEIIARTQHLGKLKRHLYRVIYSDNSAPQRGQSLKNSNDEDIGVIVSVIETSENNYRLLAVLQDRALEQTLPENFHQIERC